MLLSFRNECMNRYEYIVCPISPTLNTLTTGPQNEWISILLDFWGFRITRQQLIVINAINWIQEFNKIVASFINQILIFNNEPNQNYVDVHQQNVFSSWRQQYLPAKKMILRFNQQMILPKSGLNQPIILGCKRPTWFLWMGMLKSSRVDYSIL